MCVCTSPPRNPFIFWLLESSHSYPTCPTALCNHCSMSQAFDFYLLENTLSICQAPYVFISSWAPCLASWSFMFLCLGLSSWITIWGHSLWRRWERMITCLEDSFQRHQINENIKVQAQALGWRVEIEGQARNVIGLGHKCKPEQATLSQHAQTPRRSTVLMARVPRNKT